MKKTKEINVGIGFATGRKNFQKILKTYVYNWRESGLTADINVKLNLFVAYDLKYSNTLSTDYTNIGKKVLDLVDDTHFIGKNEIQKEIESLINENIINQEEADLFFGNGYAAKRNAVLYTAMKNKVDYLLFLDDDEYPVAVTNTHSSAIWGGQHVLLSHLKNIEHSDITNGHHCGYISPIPYIKFNEIMTELDFRAFIEAISNDIINWDKIRSVMDNGGVSYANTKVLVTDIAEEVQEIKHTKFITGANLCINLTKPTRVYPFYNPPGARGEDTFLSTCLANRKVLRIPCYTFHDGFSTYRHLMNGVLPTKLKYIEANSDKIIERFYRACIGWVRYKPLFMYITQRDNYENHITQMRKHLSNTLPKICSYFKKNEFMHISKELEHYHKNVEKHYNQFIQTKHIWNKINKFLNK
ncbi:MAG: hypothetical protein WCS83_04205 [Endomicrobiia bacterium]